MKTIRPTALFCITACLSLVAYCAARTPPAAARPAYLKGKAVLISPHATILIGKAALPLFKPCSRAAPEHISSYWTPTAADIRQLERDVPGFLKTKHLPAPSLMKHDYRQYAGFVQNGHRLIYVNGFPDDAADVFAKGKTATRADHVRWQYQAIVACDGGPSFYGMEYDPQTRQFQHLLFNGEA